METVDGSPGTRFAVAVGKGSAVLALPLTEDTESLGAFFRGVSGAGISSGGTDLERLLDVALGAFQPDFPARTKILLLSDGESLSGSLQQAAERSAAAGAAIIAVGLGSATGAEVPDLKREDGSAVLSRLRENDLRAAAQRSGGLYLDGAQPDAAEALRKHIAAAASETALEGYRRESVARGHWFLLAALAAFALSRLVETGFRRKI
jgi:Ca-activated chloride channel family protein